MHRQILVLAAALVCLTVILGCGDDGGTDVEITRPTVTQTSPENGATGVGMVPLITVSFSEEMAASSLDVITVDGITTHHVDYDTLGNKATVYISEALAGETVYSVTVPASVTDAEGHTMGSDYTFSFTTGELNCENAADYFEPNSTGSGAAEIEIPGTYPVLSSCGASDRYDYFRFTVEEPVKVTFKLKRIDGGDPVHWVANFQRHPYQIYGITDSLRTTAEMTDYYSFMPGTYDLRTGKQDEDEGIVFYSLTIETSTPCPDDIYEDNDFTFDAPQLEPGFYDDLVSCYKDLDYYFVGLDEGQTITVTATNTSGTSYSGGLYIMDPDYTVVAQDEGIQSTLSASWTATADGNYWISAGWYFAEVEYTLDIDVD